MDQRRMRAKASGATLAACMLTFAAANAMAAGGPLDIDHRIDGGANGIWNRHNQLFLQGVVGVLPRGVTIGWKKSF